MDIDLIRKQIKEKRNKPAVINIEKKSNYKKNKYIIKLMILTIIFLGSLIFTKSSSANKQLFYDIVLKDNISFASINKFYNKYLGNILPFKDLVKDNKTVFNEKLVYKEANIYKDGVALTVDESYLVPNLGSGIVIFVGEKKEYGNTVIVEQTDGTEVWYSNLDNLNVKIYDYIEEGSLIGEAKGNKLYLSFMKDGKYLDYKKYIK